MNEPQAESHNGPTGKKRLETEDKAGVSASRPGLKGSRRREGEDPLRVNGLILRPRRHAKRSREGGKSLVEGREGMKHDDDGGRKSGTGSSQLTEDPHDNRHPAFGNARLGLGLFLYLEGVVEPLLSDGDDRLVSQVADA